MSPIEIIAAVLVVGLGALLAAAIRRAFEPTHSPRVFLRRGRKPGTRTVIVCAGDSITHGVASADYLEMLRERFAGQGAEFVNAGINANLAWNLAQRLPGIIACQPDVVTLLIGTNDVNATMSQQAENRYRRRQRLPEKPTLEWYRQNVERIIDGLQAGTRARIAILTIPPLGEALDSTMNQRVNQYNTALGEIAQAKGVTLLPLHDRLTALIPPQHTPPVHDGRRTLFASALFKHYVLRQGWDAISADHGFIVLTDHIHLNDRAAAIIAELIAEFVQRS